jgi:hypothetical protein
MGVAQSLLGLGDRGAEIVALDGHLQRPDLGELLPISLDVFGDDRESGRDGVVHAISVAWIATESRLLDRSAVDIVTTRASGQRP